uniref:Uncharacterized protein n=1 Tax=Anguilla anguilla TaxID=7936 RepID=A0A0E9VWT7_ANGAN
MGYRKRGPKPKQPLVQVAPPQKHLNAENLRAEMNLLARFDGASNRTEPNRTEPDQPQLTPLYHGRPGADVLP